MLESREPGSSSVSKAGASAVGVAPQWPCLSHRECGVGRTAGRCSDHKAGCLSGPQSGAGSANGSWGTAGSSPRELGKCQFGGQEVSEGISSSRASLLSMGAKAKEQKPRCSSFCHIQDATRRCCKHEWVFPSIKAIWTPSVRLPTQAVLKCGKVTLRSTIVIAYHIPI